MAFILRGGLVASTSGVFRADVRVVGEQIHSVGLDIAHAGDEVVDVSGKYLLPGGIDVHTHFDLPLGDGTRSADSFYTGTRAALAGGTTCVVDYATQFKGETLSQGLANWHALADGNALCDYSFHMAITDWREELIADLPKMIEQGVTSFKMYMAYKGNLQVDDGVIYDALKRISKQGGLLCVHCENGDLVAARAAELLQMGMTTPEYHPVSRPEELETEAVNRLLVTAELANAPVYVVHVSAAASMARIVRAKRDGQHVFAETCPQYLYLDDSLYAEGAFEAAKYVCSPPLRDKKNWRGLWASLSGNLADVVATDHCSFNFHGQKDRGRDDFTKIPNGMPGVESRIALLHKGVAEGRISLPQLVRVSSTNPAKIFGMYPRKGAIVPGADADIVVWDTSRDATIRVATQYQNVDYTPFEGVAIPAKIDTVYLRGRALFRDGAFCASESGEKINPTGRFIPRSASGNWEVL